jgi:hypothetical protein
MSHYLFEVQERNRLAQKGLLRRFSIKCIGHQESVEEIRAEKSAKFRELREKRGTKEFDEWFLRYRPSDIAIKKNMTQKELASAEAKELKQIEKDLNEEGKIQKKITKFFKKASKHIKNKTKKIVKTYKKPKSVPTKKNKSLKIKSKKTKI